MPDKIDWRDWPAALLGGLAMLLLLALPFALLALVILAAYGVRGGDW